MKDIKDIKGYEGLYAITEDGRVWSYRSQMFLKQQPDKEGYLTVILCHNYKRKNAKVHRLVAEAYIPNPNELKEVNHKSEIKTDNSIQNLEWCDRAYNAGYSQNKKVICIELNKEFKSITEAANELGLHGTNISRCCKGKAKTTGGYHFRYKEDR